MCPPKSNLDYIHVGPAGDVHVDTEKFFKQPEVQRQLQKMKEMDMAGKTLGGNTLGEKSTTNKKT